MAASRAHMHAISLDERPLISTLFVWIPKAAGTSIFLWLNSELGLAKIKSPQRVSAWLDEGFDRANHITLGHMDPDWLIASAIADPAALVASKSFAIVRNPYSRALSLYSHFIRENIIPRRWTLVRFLEEVEAVGPQIGPYNVNYLSQASPMVNWVQQSMWPGPKRIFKLEDLQVWQAELASWLQVSGRPGLYNARSEFEGRPRIDRRSADLVLRIYEDDFEMFGYETDSVGNSGDSFPGH